MQSSLQYLWLCHGTTCHNLPGVRVCCSRITRRMLLHTNSGVLQRPSLNQLLQPLRSLVQKLGQFRLLLYVRLILSSQFVFHTSSAAFHSLESASYFRHIQFACLSFLVSLQLSPRSASHLISGPSIVRHSGLVFYGTLVSANAVLHCLRLDSVLTLFCSPPCSQILHLLPLVFSMNH